MPTFKSLRAALTPVLAACCLATAAPATQARDAAAKAHLRVVGGLAGVNQYTQFEEPFWVRELQRLSAGQLSAEIVPFDRAGIKPPEMLRLMQQGVVPFGTALLSLAAPQDMVLSAPDLAGLSPDMGSLRRTVAAYRPFLEKTLREQYGIELLAVYSYPAQVTFCNKPINGLADLAGRRVRTSSTSQSDLVEALGGTPVRTGFAEILANVQSGNIDCVITGTMSGNTIGLHEVTTHIHSMPVNWGLSIFGANVAAWQTLTVAQRNMLKPEIGKLEQQIWDMADRDTGQGVSCNIGAAACTGARKGSMKEVRASAADEARRREIFAATVLARWVQRCGAPCAQVWNQTIGTAMGITATVR